MNFYSIDTLFKQSADWEVSFDDNLQAFIIDNYYENAEDVYEWLQRRDVPLWKYNEERQTPNGIDYIDARIVDKIGHPTRLWNNSIERLLNLCRQKWHKGQYEWRDDFEVNCFKTVNITDNKLQHYPHVDSPLDRPDNLSTLNFLVYLDKEDDGGTAVYDGEWITNDENMSLLYPVEERFNLERVIPAKFNRAVIFPGNRMHGAYIEDYTKFVDNWRFTQVLFYHPVS